MSGFHKMYGGGAKENRVANDSYPTPPFATHALASIVDFRRFSMFNSDAPAAIIEPCCGRGWMAAELSKNVCKVLSSDLYNYDEPLVSAEYGIDAFEAISNHSKTHWNMALITNPPFNDDFPQRLIEAAMENDSINMVCILQRLTFMESQKRFGLFTKYPPSIVAPFSSRFSCQEERFQTNPIGGQVSYAWYVWDKLDESGMTRMQWIDGKKALADWRKSVEEEMQNK